MGLCCYKMTNDELVKCRPRSEPVCTGKHLKSFQCDILPQEQKSKKKKNLKKKSHVKNEMAKPQAI